MSKIQNKILSNVHQIVEQLPLVVFEYTLLKDGSRDFTYLNSQSESLVGVKPEEFMKGTYRLRDFIYKEDVEVFLSVTEDSFLNKKSFRWEGRIIGKDSVVWAEVSGNPINGKDGSVHYYGFIQDISARKELERKSIESEQRYKDLVENLPLGIGVHAQGKLLYANNYAAQMMAAPSPNDLIGKNIIELVHPDFREEVIARVQNIMKGLPAPPIEEKYFRLDGTILNVETSAHPYVFDGKPAIQIIVKDITERKDAETLAKKTEILFTQLFQNLPMAVVLLDEHGKVVKINKGFEEIFGYRLDELKNEELNKFIVPTELSEEGNDLNSIISNEQTIRIETLRVRKDGSQRSVIIYGVPVYFENKTIGIFGVYVDISDRRRVEEELRIRNSELDNFVYKVSHDLRAPLSSIRGLVNLAELPNNTDDLREYIVLIGKKVAQLDYFITDVLSHSKNLKMDVEIERIDLGAIINKTFSDLSYLGGADEIKSDVAITGCDFYSDPWRIAEIVRNLVSNSIKYRRKSERESFIKIRFEVNEIEAKIEFEDNGMGIVKEDLEKVFEMFYRANTRSDGSGLGLYIVKNAIDKLGGQINVHSEQNVGTTFSLQIPNNIG